MMMIDTTLGAAVIGTGAFAGPALCPTGVAGLAGCRIDLVPQGNDTGPADDTSGFATA